MEIWTLWHPNYWEAGWLKAVTAIVSVGTAIALVPLVPKALALPSPAQLEAANQALAAEIVERKKAEADVRNLTTCRNRCGKFKPLAKVPPEIEVSAKVNMDGTCEIIVADNGIGFEQKYVDRIFTVFQRLHSRSEYEGTGIGLAICRKIVERHNGIITATSSLGNGSTFIVTLPVTQPEGAAIQ